MIARTIKKHIVGEINIKRYKKILQSDSGNIMTAFVFRRVTFFHSRLQTFLKIYFRPGNGSLIATLVVVLLLVVLVVNTKAFSFHNRSLLNFTYRSKTLFSTIAPCQIFKLCPN